jgi:hypothetical protein
MTVLSIVEQQHRVRIAIFSALAGFENGRWTAESLYHYALGYMRGYDFGAGFKPTKRQIKGELAALERRAVVAKDKDNYYLV